MRLSECPDPRASTSPTRSATPWKARSAPAPWTPAPASTMQALMARFTVSRTPAREAIQQLITAGLVTSVPRQGVVVTTLTLPQFVSILEILLVLEGLGARLSARRMPAAQRRLLLQAHGDCLEAAAQDDAVLCARANRSCHEAIYDGSLNEMLASQLRAMRVRMRHPQRAMFDPQPHPPFVRRTPGHPGRRRGRRAPHDDRPHLQRRPCLCRCDCRPAARSVRPPGAHARCWHTLARTGRHTDPGHPRQGLISPQSRTG